MYHCGPLDGVVSPFILLLKKQLTHSCKAKIYFFTDFLPNKRDTNNDIWPTIKIRVAHLISYLIMFYIIGLKNTFNFVVDFIDFQSPCGSSASKHQARVAPTRNFLFLFKPKSGPFLSRCSIRRSRNN